VPRRADAVTAAGSFELIELPEGVEEAALISHARATALPSRGSPGTGSPTEGHPGILLGYGNLSEPAIRRRVHLIAQAFTELASSPGTYPPGKRRRVPASHSSQVEQTRRTEGAQTRQPVK